MTNFFLLIIRRQVLVLLIFLVVFIEERGEVLFIGRLNSLNKRFMEYDVKGWIICKLFCLFIYICRFIILFLTSHTIIGRHSLHFLSYAGIYLFNNESISQVSLVPNFKDHHSIQANLDTHVFHEFANLISLYILLNL